MEGDLYVCGFGLIVTVTGGLVSVAGYHPAWQSIHDNTPAPTFGTILAIAGLFLVAIGIILMVVNIIVWLGGRHKGDVSESAPKRQRSVRGLVCVATPRPPAGRRFRRPTIARWSALNAGAIRRCNREPPLVD